MVLLIRLVGGFALAAAVTGGVAVQRTQFNGQASLATDSRAAVQNAGSQIGAGAVAHAQGSVEAATNAAPPATGETSAVAAARATATADASSQAQLQAAPATDTLSLVDADARIDIDGETSAVTGIGGSDVAVNTASSVEGEFNLKAP